VDECEALLAGSAVTNVAMFAGLLENRAQFNEKTLA
jgi:hypothetical protein